MAIPELRDQRLRRAARSAARSLGRSTPGQRLARFWDREGLLPEPEVGHRLEAETGALRSEVSALQSRVQELEALADARWAEREAIEQMWNRVQPLLPAPTWDDLTEPLNDQSVPPLDRDEVDPSRLTEDQRFWWEQGYLIKRNFVPHELLDRYYEVRRQVDNPGGWQSNTPYQHVPEVLDLAAYRPLIDLLEELIGEPMGVSLNLTGLVSTERNWHQDDYLNPPQTKGWYAAVWFAIGDVDPESGPFQYVPGSHRWPALRRDRVRLYLKPEERDDPLWPKYAERFINELVDGQIRQRNAPVESFLGKKGDILIWHARLMHRGSEPAVRGRLRMSFISHYHGIGHWSLGPKVGRHRDGGMYFLTDESLEPA